MTTIKKIAITPLWLFKPAPWRGNKIGLVGITIIFGCIWLRPEKYAAPRALLILGCTIATIGLINHMIFLFTKEAKEILWQKGGLLSSAMTPAEWRGMRIGSLGLVIFILGAGLYWLGFQYALILSSIGWVILVMGGCNHAKWMFKKNTKYS
jgi:hypothetical protein